MRTIGFGLIGLGMMGREFAGAVARWPHLTDLGLRPELRAICSRRLSTEQEQWYRSMAPSIALATCDYRELLAHPDIDAVYVAVPHNLHAEIYCATIQAGKHLLGEKPFGIDAEANARILEAARANPEVMVRCASQFMFLPGAQRIAAMLEAGEFGRIIEAEVGFLHSSDLNPRKPINWKRRASINGEYGVLGDLGMHTLPLPLRAGWRPKNVRALLANVIPERPNPDGGTEPCDTWDNATLLCEAEESAAVTGEASRSGASFPLTVRAHRIAPGEMNSWYIRVYGTQSSAAFSTKEINRLWVLQYPGSGEQAWQQIDLGYHTPFPTVSAPTFEIGFSDALMQMWAAFVDELDRGAPRARYAGCFTPEESAVGHELFSAALLSHAEGRVVALGDR